MIYFCEFFNNVWLWWLYSDWSDTGLRVLIYQTTSSLEYFFSPMHSDVSNYWLMEILKLLKLFHLNQMIDRLEHCCSHAQFTVQNFSAFVQQSIILMATQRLEERHANRQDNPKQTVIHLTAVTLGSACVYETWLW